MINILSENNVNRDYVDWLKRNLKKYGNVKAHEMFGKLQTGDAHLENGEFVNGPLKKKMNAYDFAQTFRKSSEESRKRAYDDYQQRWKRTQDAWYKKAQEEADEFIRKSKAKEEAERRAKETARKTAEEEARKEGERRAKETAEKIRKAAREEARKKKEKIRQSYKAAREAREAAIRAKREAIRRETQAINNKLKDKIKKRNLYTLGGIGLGVGGYALYKYLKKKRETDRDF